MLHLQQELRQSPRFRLVDGDRSLGSAVLAPNAEADVNDEAEPSPGGQDERLRIQPRTSARLDGIPAPVDDVDAYTLQHGLTRVRNAGVDRRLGDPFDAELERASAGSGPLRYDQPSRGVAQPG